MSDFIMESKGRPPVARGHHLPINPAPCYDHGMHGDHVAHRRPPPPTHTVSARIEGGRRLETPQCDIPLPWTKLNGTTPNPEVTPQQERQLSVQRRVSFDDIETRGAKGRIVDPRIQDKRHDSPSCEERILSVEPGCNPYMDKFKKYSRNSATDLCSKTSVDASDSGGPAKSVEERVSCGSQMTERKTESRGPNSRMGMKKQEPLILILPNNHGRALSGVENLAPSVVTVSFSNLNDTATIEALKAKERRLITNQVNKYKWVPKTDGSSPRTAGLGSGYNARQNIFGMTAEKVDKLQLESCKTEKCYRSPKPSTENPQRTIVSASVGNELVTPPPSSCPGAPKRQELQEQITFKATNDKGSQTQRSPFRHCSNDHKARDSDHRNKEQSEMKTIQKNVQIMNNRSPTKMSEAKNASEKTCGTPHGDARGDVSKEQLEKPKRTSGSLDIRSDDDKTRHVENRKERRRHKDDVSSEFSRGVASSKDSHHSHPHHRDQSHERDACVKTHTKSVTTSHELAASPSGEDQDPTKSGSRGRGPYTKRDGESKFKGKSCREVSTPSPRDIMQSKNKARKATNEPSNKPLEAKTNLVKSSSKDRRRKSGTCLDEKKGQVTPTQKTDGGAPVMCGADSSHGVVTETSFSSKQRVKKQSAREKNLPTSKIPDAEKSLIGKKTFGKYESHSQTIPGDLTTSSIPLLSNSPAVPPKGTGVVSASLASANDCTALIQKEVCSDPRITAKKSKEKIQIAGASTTCASKKIPVPVTSGGKNMTNSTGSNIRKGQSKTAGSSTSEKTTKTTMTPTGQSVTANHQGVSSLAHTASGIKPVDKEVAVICTTDPTSPSPLKQALATNGRKSSSSVSVTPISYHSLLESRVTSPVPGSSVIKSRLQSPTSSRQSFTGNIPVYLGVSKQLSDTTTSPKLSVPHAKLKQQVQPRKTMDGPVRQADVCCTQDDRNPRVSSGSPPVAGKVDADTQTPNSVGAKTGAETESFNSTTSTKDRQEEKSIEPKALPGVILTYLGREEKENGSSKPDGSINLRGSHQEVISSRSKVPRSNVSKMKVQMKHGDQESGSTKELKVTQERQSVSHAAGVSKSTSQSSMKSSESVSLDHWWSSGSADQSSESKLVIEENEPDSKVNDVSCGEVESRMVTSRRRFDGDKLDGQRVTSEARVDGDKVEGQMVTSERRVDSDKVKGQRVTSERRVDGDKVEGQMVTGERTVDGEKVKGQRVTSERRVDGEKVKGQRAASERRVDDDKLEQKKKKRSKKKKSSGSERQEIDAVETDSWQSLPGVEPLIVTLRKNVRSGEEIPGSGGKIADVSLYTVVKPEGDGEEERSARPRPKFEHQKVTRPFNASADALQTKVDDEEVGAVSAADPGNHCFEKEEEVFTPPRSESRLSQAGSDELQPWELKHLNELSPDKSDHDQDDDLIYETIGCDDIEMDWSSEHQDPKPEIPASESRSDMDIFCPNPYDDLFIEGKNIFRGGPVVGGETAPEANDKSLEREDNVEDNSREKYEAFEDIEDAPYDEISGDVRDDLFIEGQAISLNERSRPCGEDGDQGIWDECYDEDMVKGDTYLGCTRDWSSYLEVKGRTAQGVIKDRLSGSASLGFICNMSREITMYDECYESDYGNDSSCNVDSGHGSLQVVGIGLKHEEDDGREKLLAEDIKGLITLLEDINKEVDSDHQLETSAKIKQELLVIQKVLESCRPERCTEAQMQLSTDIIRYLTSSLTAQKALFKVIHCPGLENNLEHNLKEFHAVAYKNMMSNLNYNLLTAKLLLESSGRTKEYDSAICSDSMTALDVPPYLSDVSCPSKEALEPDSHDVHVQPSFTPMPVHQPFNTMTPYSKNLMDSIGNTTDNKRKRLVLSSDSSDSSVSQSNISQCLSISKDVLKKAPASERCRHQRKRLCQVDVVPSRSAEWRHELMEEGAVTSTPVRQAAPSSRIRVDTLPLVTEEWRETNGDSNLKEKNFSQDDRIDIRENAMIGTPSQSSSQCFRRIDGQISSRPSLDEEMPASSRSIGRSRTDASPKKSLRIETGTGPCELTTTPVKPSPVQLNVRKIYWPSMTGNVATSGVRIGQGRTVMNGLGKDGQQSYEVADLMAGKRWWLFETSPPEHHDEVEEIVSGCFYSPDSEAVILDCTSKDGTKYMRPATRGEMAVIVRPIWDEEGIPQCGKYICIGNGDNCMDAQEKVKDRRHQGTVSALGKIGQEKFNVGGFSSEQCPKQRDHAAERNAGDGWKSYSPAKQLDLLNSKHSPFKVATSPAALDGLARSKCRCSPVTPRKSGDLLRDCPVSHLCPVCRPGCPCLRNLLPSPSQPHNKEFSNFNVNDTKSQSLPRSVSLGSEGMPRDGTVPNRSPPKWRRNFSTLSSSDGSWSRGPREQKDHTKKDLSSSFGPVPASIEGSSGSSSEDHLGPFHQKPKKGKGPYPTRGPQADGFILDPADILPEIVDETSLMKPEETSPLRANASPSKVQEVKTSPNRKPRTNTSPPKKSTTYVTPARKSQSNLSPARKSCSPNCHDRKPSPVKKRSKAVDMVENNELSEMMTVHPRRSRRCKKLISLSPETITPGKRRGFAHTASCTKILNELWNMDESDPFASDRKKKHEELPADYYKIVKRPMWLDWIARKLAERAYSQLREFVHDVKRIFWNCHLYNKSGKILEDCQILEEVFTELLREHFPDEFDDLNSLTGDPDECKPDGDHTNDHQDGTVIKTCASPVSELMG